MKAYELIAHLMAIPGDTEVVCVTPTDDDGETVNDIVNIGFINSSDFVLACTPKIDGETGKIDIE